jgi:hypothetical protein
MRIPIEPLNTLEKSTLTELDVKPTEPALAVRRIGANPPRHTPPNPSEKRQTGTTSTPDESSRQEAEVNYQGEDRRQAERRADGKPALLDTRVRLDRRRRPTGPKIDLEV